MAVVKNLMVRAGFDASGMNKGIHNMKKNVRGLKENIARTFKMIAMAAAAMVTAVVLAFRGSSKAYDFQIAQEVKLATIMRQRMGATDDMIQSVKDLTSAQQRLGVIGDEVQLSGAQQIATFLKQTDSLKTLIPVMNDLAAQQYGVNATGENMVTIANMIGRAMNGQIGSLSRVGISFSEAESDMVKYGTEAERAAAIAKIITNNVGEMNKALANTSEGKMRQLKNSFGDLKEQIGRAIAPLRDSFIPMLLKLIAILTRGAKVAADFMGALFGRKSQTSAVSAQTSEVEGLGDAYEEAGKKASGSLAGFDEINSLADNSVAGPSLDFGAEMGTEMFGGVGEQAFEVSEKVEEMAEKVRNALLKVKEISTTVWDGFKNAIEVTGSTLSNFGGRLIELKDNAIENTKRAINTFTGYIKDAEFELKVIAGTLLTIFVPALIRTGVQAAVTASIMTASFIVSIVRAGIAAVVSAAQITGSFIVSMISMGVQAAATAATITTQLIAATIAYAATGWRAAAAIVAQTAAWVLNKVQLGISTALLIAHKTATVAATVAQYALNVAMRANPIGLIITAIGLLVGAGVLLYKNWDKVKEMADKLWTGIKNVWNNISDHTSKIFGGIKESIGSAIDWAILKINNLIEKVNKIPLINIPTISTTEPAKTSVPKLATGGITGVNSPFMAMVGDNKTQREAIAPLDDLMGMIQTAVSATMQAMGGNGSMGDVYLNETVIGKVIAPLIDKENKRIGGNMISVT